MTLRPTKILLIFFILWQTIFLGMANAMYIEKINICDYGAKDIKGLELKLHNLILNKKNVDLASFFQNVLYKRETEEVDPIKHDITGIPLGQAKGISFHCRISEVNTNYWTVAMLEDTNREVTKLELSLIYDLDDDFSKRGEELSSDRFRTSIALSKAVNQIEKTRPETREEFRHAMLAGGFLFHRSCQDKDVVSDIYMQPLPPPNSISALWGSYFYPMSRPNVAAAFSSQSDEFLYAKPAEGKNSGNCKVLPSLYSKQMEDWLITNYPNNWLIKFADRSKKLKD